MTVLEILKICRESGVRVSVNREALADAPTLLVSTSEGSISTTIKSLLSENKQSIVRYLCDLETDASEISASHTGPFKLSHAQQRLWFISQYLGSNSIYNTQLLISLGGQVDRVALECILHEVVMRHDALRTRFVEGDNGLVQVVDSQFAAISSEHMENNLCVERIIDEERRYCFDLSEDALCRIRLLRYDDTEDYVLAITLHHIISDGWSRRLLVDELLALYGARMSNDSTPLLPLIIQYPEFSAWQHEAFSPEYLAPHLAFWKQELAGIPAMLALPTDRPRPAEQTFAGRRISCQLPVTLVQTLERVARSCDATLFGVLLGAFHLLLARYSGQLDIVTGSPVANRVRPETQKMIGVHANTLVIRSKPDGDLTLAQYLKKIQSTVFECLEHQALPFEMLVEQLNPSRSLSLSPLFQIMFAYQDAPVTAACVAGLELAPLLLEHESDETFAGTEAAARFDLTFNVEKNSEGVRLEAEFNTDLFNTETIDALLKNYVRLLECCEVQLNTRLPQIEFITQNERDRQLVDWNTTSEEYPVGQCMHHCFEVWAEDYPNHPAVVCATEMLTFQQLNEQANQLARVLTATGVAAETRVGLCVQRSTQMIVGLLAILKAGGCYVPLDPNYPAVRLAFMVRDSGLNIIVTQTSVRSSSSFKEMMTQVAEDAATPAEYQCVEIDVIANQEAKGEERLNLDVTISPANLAYLIYTSGSTGKPKGVAVGHAGWVNLTFAQRDVFGIDRHSRFMQFFSLSFDASAFEIGTTLGCGATLHIVPEDDRHSSEAMGLLTHQANLTHAVLTPSMLNTAKPAWFNPETTVIVGGETLSERLAIEWSTSHTLFNVYGPTETSIVATTGRCDPKRRPDIGRPLANMNCYVLDEYGQVLPVGVIGELFMGGAGVTRGYLNRPGLTASRFVPNPFSNQPGERLYRTGDLVRYLASGRLEFIGRTDHQMQLRGFRIELGEIESVLSQNSAVDDAVAVAREDEPGQQRLVAYVVLANDAPEEWASLINEYLQSRLPVYMVPSITIALDSLPLSSNGKVDRTALPRPDLPEQLHQYEAPQGVTEDLLSSLWCSVLRRQRVSRTDNFFGLGGHSLLATQLVSRIRETFGAELTIRHMFELQTLVSQAAAIDTTDFGKNTLSAITVTDRTVPLALSYAQQRLWFLHQYMGPNSVYNMPLSFRLSGEVNEEALLNSLSEIVSRHEALRTRFELNDDQAVQVIDAVGETLTIEKVDDAAALEVLCLHEQRYPFDLSRDSLCRIRLVMDPSDSSYILLLTLHHSVSDGWSMGVLFREFETLYTAFCSGQKSPLPPLSIQYADYAMWQRNYLDSGVRSTQLNYWREQLSGLPPLLRLPIDHARPPEQSFNGDKLPINLSASLTESLQKLSQQQGVTLFMTLLSAFSVLLNRYSGQADIAIGTPIANRTRQETEGLIGFFVNTLVMRCQLKGDPQLSELLLDTREMALRSYSHQDISFEQLVEDLNPERSLDHSPLFQVMFALQNAPPEVMFALQDISASSRKMHNVELRPAAIGPGRNVARFDLTLNVQETADGLMGSLEYNTDLFEQSTIAQLVGDYERVLSQMVSTPQMRLSDVQWLEPEATMQHLEWAQAQSFVEGSSSLLHVLFETQAARQQDRIAFVDASSATSYGALNERANRLAHGLIERGVCSGHVVGILIPSSADLATAMLATLKTGAAFVLLETTRPELWCNNQLDVCDVQIVLSVADLETDPRCTRVGQADLGQTPLQVLLVDEPSSWDGHKNPSTNPAIINSVEQEATVVFGASADQAVRVTHASLASLLVNESLVAPKSTDMIGLVSETSPSRGCFALLAGLASGAQVKTIAACDVSRSDTLPGASITMLFLDAAEARVLYEDSSFDCSGVTRCVVESQDLPVDVIELVVKRSPDAALTQCYGIAQTAGWLTARVIEPGEHKNPLSNMGSSLPGRLSLVLSGTQIVPVGAVGELCITGPGVIERYANKTPLLRQDFPLDGWSVGSSYSLWRTGRQVRRGVAGSLHAVDVSGAPVTTIGAEKLRATMERYIRLQQVEQLQDVAICIVSADAPEPVFACFYIASCDDTAETLQQKIVSSLRRAPNVLPLPSVLVSLDAFPLDDSGQLDRSALPIPELDAQNREHRAPLSGTQERLASLWCDVLEIEKVSRDDNFFALGGHSLMATRLISRILDTFGLELTIRALFEQQTLEGQAALIDATGSHETTAVAITRADRSAPLLLSYAQHRLWFMQQYMGPNAVYNMPLSFRIDGSADESALLRSLSEIVSRHEALRTRFELHDDQPVQVVDDVVPKIVVEEVDDEKALQKMCADERQYRFDLSHDRLCRIRVITDPLDSSYVLFITLHHSVSDGWSLGVLFRELEALYGAFSAGEESPLPPLPIQYVDYAIWQRSWLDSGVSATQLEYWRGQLAGLPPLLCLPLDRPRPPKQTYRGGKRLIKLSSSLTEALRKLSQEQDVTLFMTLLSAFSILLSRYSGQTDVAIGTPIANRSRQETEDLIGFFVNTLVMRCRLDGDPSFVELLQRTREMALQSYAHQDIPFEQLVEELNPQRSLDHSALFQVWFVLERELSDSVSLMDLQLKPFAADSEHALVPTDSEDGVSRFDMALSLLETDDGILGNIVYNLDLFDAYTIDTMCTHFIRVIEAIVDSPQECVNRIEYLSVTEIATQRVEWNEEKPLKAQTALVHHLFESQVDRCSDKLAVVFDEVELTFAQVNHRANQFAHHLISLGMKPDDRVAICFAPSVDMVIALLGVLKAGAAYVPIDPSYPRERIEFMLADCGASVVATQNELKEKLPLGAQTVLCLDEALTIASMAELPSGNPSFSAERLNADHLAYVIYTSGSTGRPKGVMVSHRNVGDFLYHAAADFLPDYIRGAVVSSPLAFDATVGSLHVALCAGRYIEILEEGAFALDRLADRLEDDDEALLFKITPAHLTAITAKGFMRPNPESRHIIVVAGEALSAPAIAVWKDDILPNAKFINEYGPTEATVGATTHPVSTLVRTGTGTVPIGRALGDTQLYVLNDQLSFERIGCVGQLYIGGAGLARGYLDRPGLTASRFIPNPFSDQPGERLYQTGDLVRYLTDGSLEFIGRVDHQVKLRGFRIELGEIENVLLEHESVNDAVVVALEAQPDQKQLVAYVVPVDGASADWQNLLRIDIQTRLPTYMVPSALVALSALPLTSNGKVDRAALPTPDQSEQDGLYEAPRGVCEELLSNLWCSVLTRERVSRHDNFFELGGHSLLATQLVSRIREAFGVELTIRSLFEQQTLESQANAINAASSLDSERSVIEVVSRSEPLALSYAQQRLWFLHQYMGPNAVYNMPLSFRLSGAVNDAALLRSLTTIVSRHEALRTQFELRNDLPVQVFNPNAPELAIETVEDAAALQALCQREIQHPFDLTNDCLCRIKIVVDPEDSSRILLITLHHSVADGWSLGILFRELETLYGAYNAGDDSPLAPLPVQYADYAMWQRNWLEGEVFSRQIEYWRKQLANLPPLLRLPLDRPRPSEQTFEGSKMPIQLSQSLTASLRKLSQAEGVTLFMTLLSAFSILLSRYSGQSDVAIGTPIANRTRQETEGLIGFFVNTLVMRCQLDGDPQFIELLHRIREMALQSYANQDVPFEQLVEELNPQRSLNHSPLFQVMFALRNVPMESLALDDLNVERLTLDNDALGVSRFDLTLSLTDTDECIGGLVEYNTALFDERTIKLLVEHYIKLIESLVDAPDAKLSELSLLTASESLCLADWNNTNVAMPADVCLHELFEAQVERTPDHIAVEYRGDHCSYAELNARANQLAAYLTAQNVSTGDFVALCLDRSVDMLVAILGVLKSGAAYVPIDSKYPVRRIRYLLSDSSPKVLLTQSHLSAQLPEFDCHVLYLDSGCNNAGDVAVLVSQPTTNSSRLKTHVNADALAYVIYTSGSTGEPKGVLLEHRSAAAFVHWAQSAYSAAELRAVLGSTTICFDLSIFEMFVPWSMGGKVVLVDSMLQLIAEDSQLDVSLINTVPSAIAALAVAQKFPDSTLTVNLAGEPLRQEVVDSVYRESSVTAVHNLYGPSEYTTYTTAVRVVAGSVVEPTIGRPIQNTRIFIVGDDMSLKTIGAVGQLCIAGIGIARGYLNKVELTKQKFVRNPFSDSPDERLYLTGDLARWLPDGNLEFCGRVDDQIKLRGFRIELGEIESALHEHSAVRQAVVLAREDAVATKRLLAYVVLNQEFATLSFADTLEHLQTRLPAFMLPSAMMVLDEWPLTANGKIDRQALPDPERSLDEDSLELPEGEVEERLASLWENVLLCGQVHRSDNFFMLGGHSLLVTQLASRIRGTFGVEAPIRELFQQQTLKTQAELISQFVEAASAKARREGRLQKREELFELNAGAIEEGEI